MTEIKNKDKKRPSTTITLESSVLKKAIELGEKSPGGKSGYIETLILADFKKRGIVLS